MNDSVNPFDYEVGGGEPLAEPGAAREGIVGGEAIANYGGLGDTDRLDDKAIPSETAFVTVLFHYLADALWNLGFNT